MSNKTKKRIAVVGGGIYGVTIAVRLAQHPELEVTVFEKNADILMSASMVNQYRLHRGYHYPRSLVTVQASLDSEPQFIALYKPAIISNSQHYYAIAREQSVTSASAFKEFCQIAGLEYKIVSHPLLNADQVEEVYKVKERLIDPFTLRSECWKQLRQAKVTVHLKSTVRPADLVEFDQVILATYAHLNELLKETPSYQREYQFEVCEKIAVELPAEFAHQSIVIMDGPFMCLDPFGTTEQHLLGNVVHAIHRTNVGMYPSIPRKLKPLLNQGIISHPPITNFQKFIQSGSQYVPLLAKAKYRGSMYTVRTVLPKKDKTDERPTIVKRLNSRLITAYSGKLSNCVQAAEQVEQLIFL